MVPRWGRPEADDAHVSWAREFHDAIAPFAADGVAVTFLSRDGSERVKATSGENYGRFVELENEDDPETVFRMSQNVGSTV